MVAGVVALGPAYTNGLSAFFSVIATLFFALILRRLGIPAYLLWAFAFAVVPVIFVNSTQTIDYVPALAFILAGTYFVLLGYPLTAGVCLGCAIGCRITSGAMLAPLAWWVWRETDGAVRMRNVTRLVLTTLVAGSLTYLPVYLVYRFAAFTFADIREYPEWDRVTRLGVQGVWGHPLRSVALALGLLAFLCRSSIATTLRDRTRRSALLAAALVIVLYVIAFLRLPLEAGYMIPIVPFVLLIIGLSTPPRLARPVSLGLAAAFLLPTDDQGTRFAGAIRSDHEARAVRMAQAHRVIAKVDSLPAKTVVLAAWDMPQIQVYLTPEQRARQTYVYLFENDAQIRGYKEHGWDIVYLEGLDYHNLQICHVDVHQYGARPLFATEP